jgi:hypothetical protein
LPRIVSACITQPNDPDDDDRVIGEADEFDRQAVVTVG